MRCSMGHENKKRSEIAFRCGIGFDMKAKFSHFTLRMIFATLANFVNIDKCLVRLFASFLQTIDLLRFVCFVFSKQIMC